MTRPNENARREPGVVFEQREGTRTASMARLPLGVDGLLARLHGVRRAGKQWRADCPVGHKSKGTLSIAEGDGGRILLRCWAACETAEVLAALGLELADVMPARMTDDTPESRRAAREAFARSSWSAALTVIVRETRVVLIAGVDMHQRYPHLLSATDVERLGEAVRVLEAAHAVLVEGVA